jgi:hypothetical protein
MSRLNAMRAWHWPACGPHSALILHQRNDVLGPISDSAALSIVWCAALRVLVPSPSMRPFISLPCSREGDRLVSSARGPCFRRAEETVCLSVWFLRGRYAGKHASCFLSRSFEKRCARPSCSLCRSIEMRFRDGSLSFRSWREPRWFGRSLSSSVGRTERTS